MKCKHLKKYWNYTNNTMLGSIIECTKCWATTGHKNGWYSPVLESTKWYSMEECKLLMKKLK